MYLLCSVVSVRVDVCVCVHVCASLCLRNDKRTNSLIERRCLQMLVGVTSPEGRKEGKIRFRLRTDVTIK